MTLLELHSERVPPTGAMAAEGVKNQLGRPRMSKLAILVREAVQNSWDARASEAEPIRFGIKSWVATPAQLELLRRQVFSEVPPGLELGGELDRTSMRLLALYDRGTLGLGGPTRADIASLADEPADFADFLRNIGQPPDTQLGGGTYGFGKAAFYLASSARTILVHTRCRYNGVHQSRFIGAALGRKYSVVEGHAETKYTGRHWWGRLADGLAEPLLNRDADAVATGLGLPDFEAGGRGTTIVLVAPELGDDPDLAVAEMRDAILRYFWPKMLDGTGGVPTITFEISHDGKTLLLPSPRAIPELAGFAHAFDGIKTPASVEGAVYGGLVRRIGSQRPQQHLGILSIAKVPASEKRVWFGDYEGQNGEEPFGAAAHHVALMRAPNLVVKYVAGPVLPSDAVEYCAVFQADHLVDRAFAKAEPPTHDDWIPDYLDTGNEKTYVRVAQRRIREELNGFAAPLPKRPTIAAELPLGMFSDQLGGLIPTERGTGARSRDEDVDREPSGRPGSGGVRSSRIRVLGGGDLVLVGGKPALRVPFSVEHATTAPVFVVADTGVVVEGGAMENDAPVGAERPVVLSWTDPAGVARGADSVQQIRPEEAGTWWVEVRIPEDASVNINLRITAAGAT